VGKVEIAERFPSLVLFQASFPLPELTCYESRSGAIDFSSGQHGPCKSHQQYLEWTPSRIIEWAGKVGPFTARLVESIMAGKPHPEMGYRSALGVIRLERKYGAERLEAACTRAVRLKLYRFQSVKSMLKSGLDRQPLPELVPIPFPVEHENLRGADYYAAHQTRREVGQC
jgi:hypothetical protein